MALIESPTNPNARLEVDPTHAALRAALRPFDHVSGDRVGGHYHVAARSGALTGAGIVANAPLFSMRWTNDALLFALLYLEAFLLPTVVFTAAQELGLNAILATAFTASDSAGTAISLAGGSNRARRNMATSLIGDLRIAAATLLTAGTRTLDLNAFAQGSGLVNVPNPAAGTPYVNPGGAFGFRWEADVARGQHPIVLGKDEGFLVRSASAFPAAGEAVLFVGMGWAELPKF